MTKNLTYKYLYKTFRQRRKRYPESQKTEKVFKKWIWDKLMDLRDNYW